MRASNSSSLIPTPPDRLADAPTTYSGGDSVRGNSPWCRRLFREQGWGARRDRPGLFEETAARIAEMLGPPAGPLASGDDVLPA